MKGKYAAFFTAAGLILSTIFSVSGSFTVFAEDAEKEKTLFESLSNYSVSNGGNSFKSAEETDKLAALRAKEIHSLEKPSHYRPDGTLYSTIFRENGLLTGYADEIMVSGKDTDTAEKALEKILADESAVKHLTNKNYEYMAVSLDVDTKNTNYPYVWVVLLSSQFSEVHYEIGDVNFDFSIDSLDATAILIDYAKALIDEPTEIPLSAGDFNGDGKIDSLDATAILIDYAARLLD